MQGQFSAYVNVHTGIVTIAKCPNEFEYENNTHFCPISQDKVKREVMDDINAYWEENFVPEEERILF